MGMSEHNCSQYLFHDLRCTLLRNISLFHDIVKQFSTLTELGYNVVVSLIAIKLIDFDDVGMVQFPKDFYFVLKGSLLVFGHVGL
jgi:hypothetical protein